MRTRWLTMLVAVGLVAAACGGGGEATGQDPETTTTTTTAPEEPSTTTTAAETTTTGAPEAELLVWADAARGPVVEEIAPAFTEATGVAVSVEILEFGQIRDQVGIAGPAGEGPDLFIGAHDWTGQLVLDGAVEPIDLGPKADQFFDVALTAFTLDGSLYAVPYATEAIALYYNADLVPEPPETFEEIPDICAGLEGIENCVGLPGGGDQKDAYHHYPFVSALGGYIFAYDPATGYDPTDIGLDSQGAIDSVAFLAQMVSDGVIESVNYDTAKTLFLEGKQPFWITGPWELGNLRDQDAINWGVAKLPTIGGEAPKPFVGAQGFFLSAFSENKVIAQSFLLDYLATEEGMQALYEADPRNPAFRPVFDQIADDPVAQTFALSAADGVPMPSIPQMASVWDPLGDALLLVRNGELDAEAAMTQAAESVRQAVSG